VKEAAVLIIRILVTAAFLAYWYYFHSCKLALMRRQLVEKLSRIKTLFLQFLSS